MGSCGNARSPEEARHPCAHGSNGRRLMLGIATQQFVGALARECNGDVARGELGQREEADRREVGEWLVEEPREPREVELGVGARELELVVVGSEPLRDLPGISELVQVVLDEADGERLDRTARVARHQRDDQARVEPAAQHRAEWHVAHQPEPH